MNLKKTCFPILIASFMTAHAQAYAFDGELFIIRGMTVEPADPIASTTVAVVNESHGDVALCTGSIVAPDLVVTAGHCVGPDRAAMRLFFKTDLRQAGGKEVPVAGYVRPKGYGHMTSEEDMNDIALIRFEGGLPPGYRPAELLRDEALLKNGEKVTLAGFGVSNGRIHGDGSSAGAGVLRKVDVTIAQAAYGRTEVVMDQTHGHGACHGDSGGPAFLKRGREYLLFGVTSRGSSGGRDDCSGASIYTSILAHARFLREAAGGLRAGRSMP
jgi:secreted trypsin-like serine protease